MSELTAKRLAWSGVILFGISMLVPPQAFPDDSMRQDYGFQLVALSFIGSMHGFPLCIVGLIANVGFLSAALLLLTRVARGRPWPSFHFIAWLAICTAIAMAVARIWLVAPHLEYCLAPGFLLWLGGAVMLAIGSWRLRIEAAVSGAHGFEVIPIARIAPDNEGAAIK